MKKPSGGCLSAEALRKRGVVRTALLHSVIILLVACYLLVAISSYVSAALITSSSYQIVGEVNMAGSARMSSSGYILEVSLGQTATGKSTSSSYIVEGGFWPKTVVPPAVIEKERWQELY